MVPIPGKHYGHVLATHFTLKLSPNSRLFVYCVIFQTSTVMGVTFQKYLHKVVVDIYIRLLWILSVQTTFLLFISTHCPWNSPSLLKGVQGSDGWLQLIPTELSVPSKDEERLWNGVDHLPCRDSTIY